MIRKNVYAIPRAQVVAHHGSGSILFTRPFDETDFETDASFIDFVEIPPGASIGVHTHGENEEIYFIIEGSGSMRTNAEVQRVGRGDLVLNRRGWSHGLSNDSDAPLLVLVMEVAYRPDAPKRSSASRSAS